MTRVLLAMVVALGLAGCGERGTIGGLLLLEGRHTINGGTTLAGDLFVLDGQVSLHPGGRITGSAFVLGGEVVIGGAVDGDIAVIGGRLRLTETATVAGALRRGGGQVALADGAMVGTALVSPVAVDALIGLTRPAPEADGFSAWLAAASTGWWRRFTPSRSCRWPWARWHSSSACRSWCSWCSRWS